MQALKNDAIASVLCHGGPLIAFLIRTKLGSKPFYRRAPLPLEQLLSTKAPKRGRSILTPQLTLQSWSRNVSRAPQNIARTFSRRSPALRSPASSGFHAPRAPPAMECENQPDCHPRS